MTIIKSKNRRVCAMPDLPPGRAYRTIRRYPGTAARLKVGLPLLERLPRSGMAHTLVQLGDVT